jgi:RNA polymerase sigma factor (sigma-70 family)
VHRDDEAELDSLMDRLADGDRSAFDPLYRALWPRAVRLAHMRLGAEHAEDAAQATMLRVFSRASEFDRGRAVLPWFYAIASNEVRAISRRVKPRAAVNENDAAHVDDPESELCARELSRALERAIAELDGDSADAIYAVLERGPRPQMEAATFRKRVSRAYTRLRTILGGANG